MVGSKWHQQLIDCVWERGAVEAQAWEMVAPSRRIIGCFDELSTRRPIVPVEPLVAVVAVVAVVAAVAAVAVVAVVVELHCKQ